MDIKIVSLFPQLYHEFLSTSLIKRARETNKVSVEVKSLLNYVKPGVRVDAPTVGHGAGMLLKAEVIDEALQDAGVKKQKNVIDPLVIFFSPHGKSLDQRYAHELYEKIKQRDGKLVLCTSRYEGIDARAEEYYADELISIGNYVLMGGDLPAMVLLEAILRFVPGIVGREESVKEDSFEGLYVDHPHYAEPDIWKGKQIPPILKSGNHKKIALWREEEARKRTVFHHFQWLKSQITSRKERSAIAQTIPNHYCALMHNDIMLPDGTVGTSSVTSIDIHDLARSSRTYGIKHYFVVTRLEAQQKLVKHFLSFWQEGEGVEYNKNRHDALQYVSLLATYDEVIASITEKEGVTPIVIVTSSRDTISKAPFITYYDQGKVWALKRPVLFIFGTAHGLSPAFMDTCDFRLLPLEGFSDFNFLSVRSAAAIILDRWLGINPCYT